MKIEKIALIGLWVIAVMIQVVVLHTTKDIELAKGIALVNCVVLGAVMVALIKSNK